MPKSDPASTLTIVEVLTQVRSRLNLEAEAEHELLAELRGHLEEAVEAARAAGCDEATALAQAAARLGVDDTGRELQATHAGRGALNGIALAAVPVLLALALRWSLPPTGRPSAGSRPSPGPCCG